MLEANTFHPDRAACYWAFFRIKQLENFLRYDPSTTQGEELHRILDAAPKFENTKFPKQNYSLERAEIEDQLNSKDYKPFWDKYRQAKKRPKNWYGLCSNRDDLRGLANLIGHEAEYVLLYRMLSKTAHASDVFTGVLKPSPRDGVLIHQIRGPEQKIREATSLAANYLVACHQLILNTYYTKDHDLQKWFARWYVGEYRPLFLWATGAGTPHGPEQA